jgi:hypothetical protein
MPLFGLIFAAVGVVLVTNLGGIADSMAGLARPWPAWMRAPYSDTVNYYRVMGGLFVVLGLVFIAAAVRGS